MPERVCPWWMGRLLLNPWRRWSVKPDQLLEQYVHDGMTVLEPGPGMGFFTLSLARLVGANGRVIAVDLQSRMLDRLRRRAQKAGLESRIETRIATCESMRVTDLTGNVDFVLASAVVHEMPGAARFFLDAAAVLKPGALLLLVEPVGHVKSETFAGEVRAAKAAGLMTVNGPVVRGNHTILLRKSFAAV